MNWNSTPPLMPEGFLAPLTDVDARSPRTLLGRLQGATLLRDRAAREEFLLKRLGRIHAKYSDAAVPELAFIVADLGRAVRVLKGRATGRISPLHKHTVQDVAGVCFRIPGAPVNDEDGLHVVYMAALYTVMQIYVSKVAKRTLRCTKGEDRRELHFVFADLEGPFPTEDTFVSLD